MGRTRIHDEATAAALVDAAERIVEREGLAELTVRRVAAETGTTTRAVYSAVGSKAALEARLGVRAFELLGALVGGLPLTADPVADLVTAGTAGFRSFATSRPALFRVGVQSSEVPPEAAAEIRPAAWRALATLHARVQRLADAGGLGGRSVGTATWEFHALCEGLAAVELRGGPPAGDGEQLWRDALTTLVAGWAEIPAGGRAAPSTPG